MVFKGGYSKGCQTCRSRRIKCDEGRPTCARCAKSKRVCRGYRDETDLLFRNKTYETVRCGSNSSASTRESPSDVPNGSSTSLTPNVNSPARSVEISPNNSLTQLLEDAALNFFFNHYVLIEKNSNVSAGYFDCLPALYSRTKPGSALSSVTMAISLCVYGISPGRRDLLPRARLKYGETLNRVKKAILDPIASKENETLMTILLFSLVESITATSESVPHWGTHGEAAIALVRLRGKEMLNDDLSLKLLFLVRMQMIRTHNNRSKVVVDFFDDEDPSRPSWADVPAFRRESPDNHLINLFVPIPGLRVLAVKLLRQPKDDSRAPLVLDLIKRAEALDEAISSWPDTIPKAWKYTTFTSMASHRDDDHSGTYLGKFDVYCDVWVSSIWSTYRIMRLFLQAIVLRCIAWLCESTVACSNLEDRLPDPALLPALTNARTVLRKMVDEICASVPYHIGFDTNAEHPTHLPSTSYLSPPESANNHAPRTLGGFFLVWPLLVARSVTIIPQEQKIWLKGRMMHIANNFGIHLLGVMALRVIGWDGWPLFDVDPRDGGKPMDKLEDKNNIWR